MIITELDKYSVRAAHLKAIRQGTLVPGPCALCGKKKDTLVYLANYGAPQNIQWLCRTHKKFVRSLSALQRFLLKRGLRAYYRKPPDLACNLDNPACFSLKATMTDFDDRRERARRRAAAGLAVARLLKRGLLERSSRGWWRLSKAGLALAQLLHPQVKPRSKREMAANIALRKAIQSWEGGLCRPPNSRVMRRVTIPR